MALGRLHATIAYLGRRVDDSSTREVARLLRLAQDSEPWLALALRPGAAAMAGADLRDAAT